MYTTERNYSHLWDLVVNKGVSVISYVISEDSQEMLVSCQKRKLGQTMEVIDITGAGGTYGALRLGEHEKQDFIELCKELQLKYVPVR